MEWKKLTFAVRYNASDSTFGWKGNSTGVTMKISPANTEFQPEDAIPLSDTLVPIVTIKTLLARDGNFLILQIYCKVHNVNLQKSYLLHTVSVTRVITAEFSSYCSSIPCKSIVLIVEGKFLQTMVRFC